MHEFVNGSRNSSAVRLALAGVIAALLAGCSSDATRFSGDPLTSPFGSASGSADKRPVASIQPSSGQSYAKAQASSGGIESHPLAPPSTAAVARYSAPATPNPPLTARNSGSEVAATGSTTRWSSAGGTPIVVGTNDTVGGLSARYGVPADALLQANGLNSAAEVHPGSRLVIPVYNASAAPVRPQRLSEAAPPPRTQPKIPPTRTIPERQVATREPARETLHFVKGPQPAKLGAAQAPARSPEKPSRSASAKPLTKPVPDKASKPVADKGNVTKPQKNALVEKPAPAQPKRQIADLRKPAAIDSTATGSLPPAATPVAPAPSAAPQEAANPEFRWPAHGRIIQGFNGGNDGINIAVPEGTAVKAAEDGVVAYAGDELKGYGKLVLIRHPNGFVSAYANNEDIAVKKGDSVKRGQVIARSGQSGNVASPQLHFELRKGSTPVDPTQYLAGL